MNSRNGRSCSGRKTGKGPIHVLFPCHVNSEQKPKHKEPAATTQHKNTTKTTHTKKAENRTAQKQ